MKKKILLSVVVLFLSAAFASAVLNEKDMSQTLSVLRAELKAEKDKLKESQGYMTQNNREQRRKMIKMLEKCNELSLMLYSQNQDYTFDLTYSLKESMKQYEQFSRDKIPYDDILNRLDIEIDRYEHLIEALRRIPPMLEEIAEVPDSIRLANVQAAAHEEQGHNHEHEGEQDEHDLTITHHEGEDHHSDSAGDGHADLAAAGLEVGHSHEKSSYRGRGERRGPRPDGERRRLPFMLDSLAQVDRDSCIAYAREILAIYKESHERTIADNEHYINMDARLKETHDYAQKRYTELQKRIFVDGSDNYITILGDFDKYKKLAQNDIESKYSTNHGPLSGVKSDWRGPMVNGFMLYVLLYLAIAIILSKLIVGLTLRFSSRIREKVSKQRKHCITLLLGSLIFAITVFVANFFVEQNFFVEASGLLTTFAWLLIAIFGSLFIHMNDGEMKEGIKLYFPMLVMGIIVITFRVLFIPNSCINLLFPAILLLITIWQLFMLGKLRDNDFDRVDVVITWISTIVLVACTIVAWCGFVLMSVQILIWWLFQLTAIQMIAAAHELLGVYERTKVHRKISDAHKKVSKHRARAGEYIMETWVFDLIKIAIVPVVAIASFPLCIYLAADIFDLTAVCSTVFYHPFLDVVDTSGNAVLHLSLYKLVLASALYFIFSFATYAIKAFYKSYKLDKVRRESGQEHVLANQVNLTLANNVINICLWGIYVIAVITLFKIPMGAISVVAAGLATGIGLALKDVLNNFIYGIQLMSGRVRVGDMIECDGMRGKVESISYQSTQVVTIEGALLSITNTSLFNKTFKNLTRTSPYEYVGIEVGVSYGTDAKAVCELLKDVLSKNDSIDKYGRPVLDPNYGIKVVFSGFGDSSVNLLVKQFVIVEEEPSYIPATRQIIYDTLNANGIEIPFPQRDIHIKKDM